MVKENKILIIAGEVSGDIHGAALIRELKTADPSLSFIGVGGDRMRHEGMSVIEHINNMAFLGFIEVIKHLPFIRKVKNRIIDAVKNEDIKTVVLIDYPGFNLNMAKHLKRLGVKVVYYITPQVWAWGKGRIKTIRKLVDKVIVILPFEKEFFKKNGIDSVFVGHPLIDALNSYNFISKEKFYSENNLDINKDILALLPGSRRHEVLEIFPESIKAAKKLTEEFGMQTVVACPDNIDAELFEKYSKEYNFTIIRSNNYELLKYAKAGIIKSGTSTLEAALFELPMVVVYRTSPLTYVIGKNLVSVKNIGLVNIIAGETIVPELIQDDLTGETIYREIRKFLEDKHYLESVKNRLGTIKNKLGSGGASFNAASEIIGVLESA